MNMTKSGTLGGFVTLQNPERQCFLTCAHVVLPIAELTKEKLGKYARKREIKVADKQKIRRGSVENIEFKHGTVHEVSIDAALIEITEQDRKPCNGEFAKVYTTEQFSGAGFSKENMPNFVKGEVEQIKMYNFRKPVLKIGANTGITLGSLKIGRSCARIFDFQDVVIEEKFSITLCKQMEVLPQIDPSLASDSREPFIDIGDSGSFVFFISHDNPLVLRCIGLAVAKTSYGSCIMTPIDKVFDALRLPHDCLSKFTKDVAQSEMYQSNLKDIFNTILTDVSSNMATKDDIKNINQEMKKINERLSTTESEVHMLKETQKDNAI
ncbi:uncharacterized protein LOC134251785 [Saccostrea cucullata]|uniref:uncharacterized protein LOC134251785 n=1 Tax=Saccostrea cuccullata TaxID=36930 RepID=UPI002ED2916E